MENQSFIRKYWKQIDLHSHTLRGVDCTGKSDSAGYQHRIFKDNLVEFQTQLQAVTNHNTLNLDDHIKHAIICDLIGVNYIPGVEIDVRLKDKTKPFHCVFLLGPDNDICIFADRLNKLTSEKRRNGEVYFDEEKLSDLFSGMHFIYVVHAVKAKGLAESQETIESDKENINWVCNAIKNALAQPILFENTKPKYVHSFMNRFREFTDRDDIIKIASQQVTTSDYKFDGDLQRHEEWKNRDKYAICAEPTFEGLEISIRHYKSRFQLIKEIVEPPAFIEKISFIKQDDSKLKIDGSIDCSPYFNVIIGNSGSGKTLLLNEIYRSVSNPSKNLNAVLINSKKEKETSDSVYSEYIGKKNSILIPVFYKGNKPVAVEIDKIYKRMLDANKPSEIARLFGVGLPENINTIIQNYRSKVLEYENAISRYERHIKSGETSILNLKSNIIFIKNNKTEGSVLKLQRQIYDLTKINSINNEMTAIEKLLKERPQISDWFKRASRIISDKTESIVSLEKHLDEIETALKRKKIILDFELKGEEIARRVIELYNAALDSINRLIGNKQVAISRAESVIKEQTNQLRDSLKEAIKESLLVQNINLKYPFDDIKSAAIKQQNNKYARIAVKYSAEDDKVTANGLNNHRLIDCTNNVTKIRNAVGSKEYSLSKDEDVKQLIKSLRYYELSFASLLKDEVPFITELFDAGSWKDVRSINPGNLAKDYMFYYFNKVLETQRPNIVFIDQPENDVDKSFIHSVLANFITNNKIGIQFFITSHEPILGVNADSNLIIESYRNENGAISYNALNFESRPTCDKNESGKNVAARILDGGKENVIQRNQIYGGSLDD